MVIAGIIIGYIGYTLYAPTPTPTPTPSPSPTPTPTPTPTPSPSPTPTEPFPTRSPYLTKFRQQPELFVTRTQIVHALFEDEEGNLLANLTGVCQAERVNYTVYATLNYSLTADPSVANITFGAGIKWYMAGHYEPVPLPIPLGKTYMLQDGESVAVEITYYEPDFEPDWEWVQLQAVAVIYNFEVGFVDGYVWRDFEMGEIGQIYDWVNYIGDLFKFLHNNPIETETITLKVKGE